MGYTRRLVDDELDTILPLLPAVALEGAKGVGKTATAVHRADDIISLDKRLTRLNIEQDPDIVLSGQGTVFIDEWQLVPDVWNVVKRAVDDGAEPGKFLLAGSASPRKGTPIHSGAGRIVQVVMRPMSLPERQVEEPTVSLSQLLNGESEVEGTTQMGTADYVGEILRSGFPGIRSADEKAIGLLLDSYIARTIDHDIEEAGAVVRRPQSLKNWMAAYGAATATTGTYASILDAAEGIAERKPSKPTAVAYRDLLQRMWILEPLPAWVPTFAHLRRLGASPKHHLVDPALAARLVGATADSLLKGDGPPNSDGTFVGALFESLALQTVRCLLPYGSSVCHFRTHDGEHEVDIIVERPDLKVLAIEVKMSPVVRPSDVTQLKWLDQEIPGRVVGKVIVNTGDRAYLRKDGVSVVPLALLGK